MKKKETPVYNINHLSTVKQNEILISRLSIFLDRHKNLHSAHKHSFYHLILFINGGGRHEIDFHGFPVEPFQIYFMLPGQVHSWDFSGEVDGYVVNFSEQFFQTFLVKSNFIEQFPFFNGIVEDSVISLPITTRDRICSYFEELITESESGLPFGIEMIKALLLQIFCAVGRISFKEPTEKSNSHNLNLLKNFNKLIEKNYASMRLPKDYADLLFVTPNYLNSLCRELLGITSGDLIRKRTVLEAKRMLVNADLNISEIAYRLNFVDNSYFSKFFKKQEGISPEEFRRNEIIKVKNSNSVFT